MLTRIWHCGAAALSFKKALTHAIGNHLSRVCADDAFEGGLMRIDQTSTGMTGDAAIALRPAALLSAINLLSGGLLLLIGP